MKIEGHPLLNTLFLYPFRIKDKPIKGEEN
jgi:hypothetical protein